MIFFWQQLQEVTVPFPLACFYTAPHHLRLLAILQASEINTAMSWGVRTNGRKTAGQVITVQNYFRIMHIKMLSVDLFSSCVFKADEQILPSICWWSICSHLFTASCSHLFTLPFLFLTSPSWLLLLLIPLTPAVDLILYEQEGDRTACPAA